MRRESDACSLDAFSLSHGVHSPNVNLREEFLLHGRAVQVDVWCAQSAASL